MARDEDQNFPGDLVDGTPHSVQILSHQATGNDNDSSLRFGNDDSC